MKFKYKITVLFLIGVIIRCIFVMNVSKGITPDSYHYYTAALNIANGNGYSIFKEKPYYPFYFREPGISYVYSVGISIYKSVNKVEKINYPKTWVYDQMDKDNQVCITIIVFFNAVIQMLALLLLYLSFLRICDYKNVSCWFLLSVVYLPFWIFCTYLWREPYLLLSLSLVTYFWVRYCEGRKLIYLISCGFFIGMTCLFLQIYWLLLVIAVLMIFVKWGVHLRALKHSCVIIVAFLLPVLPWCINVYSYYPDIRICKTLGSALTYEYVEYLNAVRLAGYDPYKISQAQAAEIGFDEKLLETGNAAKVLEYSFNGTYHKGVFEMSKYFVPKDIFKDILGNVWPILKNTFCISGYPVSLTSSVSLFLNLFALIIGVFAVIGVFRNFNLVMNFPVVLFQLSLCFVLSSEERRQLPLLPFLLLFSIQGFIYVKKYVEKIWK